MGKVIVRQWVDLLREGGLTDADMIKWHRFFEEKYPQGHQSFLEWLGLDAERMKTVRNQ